MWYSVWRSRAQRLRMTPVSSWNSCSSLLTSILDESHFRFATASTLSSRCSFCFFLRDHLCSGEAFWHKMIADIVFPKQDNFPPRNLQSTTKKTFCLRFRAFRESNRVYRPCVSEAPSFFYVDSVDLIDSLPQQIQMRCCIVNFGNFISLLILTE